MPYIVSDKNQYNHISNNFKNKTIYTDDYSVFLELKNHGVIFLYDFLKIDNNFKLYNYITETVLNWYRDINGKDVLFKNNNSVGPIISRRLGLCLGNDLRNLECFLEILKKNENIYIHEQSCLSYKRIKKILGGKILFYECSDNNNKEVLGQVNSPERAIFHDIKIHKITGFFRLLQTFFIKIIRYKKMSLIESDWFSIDYFKKNKNVLTLNSRNFFKGYYPYLKKKYLAKAEKIIPTNVNPKVLNLNHFEKKLFFKDYKNKTYAYELIKTIVNDEFCLHRKKIVRAWAIYDEIFDFYKPESIILAGQNAFYNIIALQAAKSKKVKSKLAIDGFTSALTPSDFYKDELNDRYYFDEFLAYGESHFDLFSKKLDSNKNKITKLARVPLVDLYKSKNIKKSRFAKKQKKYDAMILAYGIDFTNPSTYMQNCLFIESNIILLLDKMGFENIGIKIKTGGELTTSFQNKSIKEYKEIIKVKHNYTITSNISLIDNVEMYEVINSTNLMIGSNSSAIAEALYNDIKYIIYEPMETGLPNYIFDSTIIFNSKTVARNLDELKNMIINKQQSIVASKKYVLGI